MKLPWNKTGVGESAKLWDYPWGFMSIFTFKFFQFHWIGSPFLSMNYWCCNHLLLIFHSKGLFNHDDSSTSLFIKWYILLWGVKYRGSWDGMTKPVQDDCIVVQSFQVLKVPIYVSNPKPLLLCSTQNGRCWIFPFLNYKVCLTPCF